MAIGLFGRRNVGKSSVLNAITNQQTSIVSAVAGTTADPVDKPMELLPLGPVLFIDTAASTMTRKPLANCAPNAPKRYLTVAIWASS